MPLMLMRCSVVRSVYFVQPLSVSRITMPLTGLLGVPFVIQRGGNIFQLVFKWGRFSSL